MKEEEKKPSDYVEMGSTSNYSVIPLKPTQNIENITKYSSALPKNWTIETSEVVIEAELGKGSFGVVFKGKW